MKTSNRFIAGLCALFIVAGALAAAIIHLNYPNLLLAQDPGTDTDADGMTDLYEAFFGLDGTNPSDADADFDDDTLANLAEAMLMTDPGAPDTDMDGLDDAEDGDPISRVAIRWGNPDFTTGDSYGYTGQLGGSGPASPAGPGLTGLEPFPHTDGDNCWSNSIPRYCPAT